MQPETENDKKNNLQSEQTEKSGWLKFLLFLLLLGTPISTVLDLVNTYLQSSTYALMNDLESSWNTSNLLQFLLPPIIIVAFSIYAGSRLLTEKIDAPKIVRVYFHTRIGFGVLYVATASYFFNSAHILQNGIFSIIYASFWLIFLANSNKIFPSASSDESIETNENE